MEGDGIGPEITAATMAVLRAAERGFGLALAFEPVTIGLAALRLHGTTLPPGGIRLREGGRRGDPRAGVAQRISAGRGGRPQSVGRAAPALDLYANIRPAKSRGGFAPRCGAPVDLVVARENTEGFYADRSMFAGSGEFMPTAGSRARRAQDLARGLDPDRGGSIRARHAPAPESDGGAQGECAAGVGRAVPRLHPRGRRPLSEVQYEERIIDAMAALLVRDASAFDVIVTTNMFGDILSDLASEISGSLGLAASLNAGTDACGRAGPARLGARYRRDGSRQSGLADRIGGDAAGLARRAARDDRLMRARRAIEAALERAIAGPQWRTADLGGPLGTRAFGERVAAMVENAVA